MNIDKKQVIVTVFTAISLLVFMASYSTEFIDNQYVSTIYPLLSKFFRWLWVYIPFSVGDVLYLLLITGGLIYFIRLIRIVYKLKKAAVKSFLIQWATHALLIFLSVYIIFNIFWGLNYHRSTVDKQWGMDVQPYTQNELEQLNELLVTKANVQRAGLPDSILHQSFTIKELQKKTCIAYEGAAQSHPFLTYPYPSIKPSLFSSALSYLGISGYYNPFTGEAQVNRDMPAFLQPFTCCHEVAHQLGYAKENEANWVGYVVAIESADKRLQYAATFEMMIYANRSLYAMDSVSASNYRKKLDERVRSDWKLLNRFFKTHQSIWEPAMDQLYEWFLKSHQQPEGLVTYERVTGWLIGYYKQKGLIR